MESWSEGENGFFRSSSFTHICFKHRIPFWEHRFGMMLMAEILHQLIGSISHYLQGFIHPRWCRISAINSIMKVSNHQRSWWSVATLTAVSKFHFASFSKRIGWRFGWVPKFQIAPVVIWNRKTETICNCFLPVVKRDSSSQLCYVSRGLPVAWIQTKKNGRNKLRTKRPIFWYDDYR